MPTCVVYNPNAGSADAAAAMVERLQHVDGYAVCEADDARAQAARAAREGYDRLLAIGGDGTVSQVVNGLVDALGEGGLHAVTLGLIPLGTGNDLARTLTLPEDPALALALALATTGPVRALDLIRVTCAEGTRYGVNACSGGVPGEVDRAMSGDEKETWGPLAYLLGAARVLPNHRGFSATLAWDDEAEARVDALSVVVANGRTVGGGRPAAPRANPEDGLLDVVVIHDRPALDLAGLAARALAGDYLDAEGVTFRRARRVRVAAEPGMPFNVDGELFTDGPVTFEAVPRVLPVVVGPGYRAVSPLEPAAP